MNTSTIGLSAANKILAIAIGEYVWASRVAQDAILRLDLGSARLQVHEPSPRAAKFTGDAGRALGRRVVLPVGRWHLFVESGLWRIAVMGMACDRTDAEGGSSEKLAKVTKCLSLLDGQKLNAVSQIEAGGGWQFEFDLGGTLSITPAAVVDSDEPEAVWTFFFDAGSSLSFMSDRTLALEEPATISAPSDPA